MTKDEFHKSAQAQNNQTPPVKKDTAGKASVQARAPQPPAPGPLVPKPPFGMPTMPVVKTIKVALPSALPKKDGDSKEPDIKYPE